MKKILVMASVMMLGGSGAWALGTDAGTDISNSATLSYKAGGVDQPDVTTQQPDTFKVDKKVDMVLTTTDPDQLGVTPGQADRITHYTFKNEGNADQKFTFAASDLANNEEADYDTDKDNQDTDALTIEYSTDGGNTWQAYNSAITVPKDTEVKFRVKANIKTAANGAANGDIMNVQLEATAVQNDGTTPETESANEDPAVVDVVLADGVAVQNGATTPGGQLGDTTNGKGDTPKDGKEAARSGYIIQTPVLSLDKTSCVISDPVNNTNKPKRIPGAVIRYLFHMVNIGGASATNVTLTDTLNSALDVGTIKNVVKKEGVDDCTCTDTSNTSALTHSKNGQDVTLTGINVPNTVHNEHTCAFIEVEIK